MNAQRWVLGIVGVAALVGGAAALAARIFAPTARQISLSPDLTPDDSIEDLPPDSTAFEPEPLSESTLTVRPRTLAPRRSSADDWESFGSDELGAAYLSRATEQGLLEEDSLEAELVGFQIIDRA